MPDEVHKIETGLSLNNCPLCKFVLVAFLLFLFNSLKLHLIGYIMISFENTLYSYNPRLYFVGAETPYLKKLLTEPLIKPKCAAIKSFYSLHKVIFS